MYGKIAIWNIDVRNFLLWQWIDSDENAEILYFNFENLVLALLNSIAFSYVAFGHVAFETCSLWNM